MESIFAKLTARPQRSIIFLSLILMLAGNWILPLTDRDEARFGEASREMIQRGDYIVPWFNGEWRLYKPVLIYWCQIASYKIFGSNEFAARLPSALFTTATALLLVRWGRKTANARTGFTAGAMYVTAIHVAVIGRVSTADPALFFFFTLAAWGGWELTRPDQPQRQKWWWIFYIAMALGFLAKGPEAWLPLGGMILGRALRKDAFRLPVGETVVGLVLASALVAMWGIPAIIQTNGEYWRFGMGNQVFDRAVGIKDNHGLGGVLGFVATLPVYFLTFFISFFPWSIRVPSALRRWWPERKRDDLGWYLFVNAALIFIAFSLVKTKLPHYTMPAFALIALWLARQTCSGGQSPVWFNRGLAIMVAVILAMAFGGFTYTRSHMLTQNLWDATKSHVRPETKIGCYGFTEASLVWKFRTVATNCITLGSLSQAKDFLTNTPPFVLVIPTESLTNLPDTNGTLISVSGIDVVKFKNRNLTAIIR